MERDRKKVFVKEREREKKVKGREREKEVIKMYVRNK